MSATSQLWTTFAIYLIGMLGIGFSAWRRTRSFDDYILGGRGLSPLVTALSTGASDMSGWLLMGLPGALFASGLAESWIVLGLVIGAWLNWRLVAGSLRIYTERAENALTLPDYFTYRFEDRQRLLGVFSALVILVFFAIYSASGIVAGTRLFESTFANEYHEALWAGAAATIIYTLVGGFLAVSWTDTVQGTLMILALMVAPAFVINASGGPVDAYSTIASEFPAKVDWFHGTSFVGIESLMAWDLKDRNSKATFRAAYAANSCRQGPGKRAAQSLASDVLRF